MNLERRDWVAVICAKHKTLALAQSLAEAGFEAWTPVEIVQRRAREGAKPEPVPSSLMPRYVFARADRLQDLLQLARSPSLNYRIWDREQGKMVTKGHPHYRMFRSNGDIRPIPERHLAALRSLEHKRRPKPEAEALEVGVRIRLSDGGFEGLWATVTKSRKSRTVLVIDDWGMEIDVPTWSLREALDTAADSHVSNDAQALRAKAA